jgi:hypothetical protein
LSISPVPHPPSHPPSPSPIPHPPSPIPHPPSPIPHPPSPIPSPIPILSPSPLLTPQGENSTVSDLTPNPREMNITSQLLYKWISPLNLIQRVRFFWESVTKKPVDWNGENDRNLLMFESAVPLAKLYQPLIFMAHTFVLQEYFIPRDNFQKWMSRVKPLVTAKYNTVTLLNMTIRYLRKDETTFLPYAKNESYAFVLYFRLHNLSGADDEVRGIHQKLASVALSMDGTFFVPYRHHYTSEQLETAYPEISEFFMKKENYDPENLFSNLWYTNYGKKYRNVQLALRSSEVDRISVKTAEIFETPIVSERRTDSYKKMVNCPVLRRKFQQFLEEVFNVEEFEALYAIVAKAVCTREFSKNVSPFLKNCRNYVVVL